MYSFRFVEGMTAHKKYVASSVESTCAPQCHEPVAMWRSPRSKMYRKICRCEHVASSPDQIITFMFMYFGSHCLCWRAGRIKQTIKCVCEGDNCDLRSLSADSCCPSSHRVDRAGFASASKSQPAPALLTAAAGILTEPDRIRLA